MLSVADRVRIAIGGSRYQCSDQPTPTKTGQPVTALSSTSRLPVSASALSPRGSTDPRHPASHTTACTATTEVASTEARKIVITDPSDPIMTASAPYHEVANDVRMANKYDFEKRRAALRKAWPVFDTVYDDYRRWRDAAPADAGRYALKGMHAQREIMKLSGVLGSGEAQLFSMLGAQSDLLRYVSPVNGDFRAPKQGLIAGFRYADTPEGKRPTLAFPGTGSGSMIRSQLEVNVSQFLDSDGVPAAHQLAAELATEIGNALTTPDATSPDLAFTGHSLGGAVASYVAASIARPPPAVPNCYLFNPAALGGGVMKALNRLSGIGAHKEKQVIIRVRNDHVSSPAMQRRLAVLYTDITSRLIAVPRHLGNTIHVVPREMLDPADRGLLKLHKLESLGSLYKQARNHAQAGSP